MKSAMKFANLFACRGEGGRQTLPSFVPSIMLTLLSGTENGDSSNTCWTCGMERKNTKAKQREKLKKQQRNGISVIYSNGPSSTGTHKSKGLIPSGGLMKYHLSSKMPQGHPLESNLPLQDPTTLSSQHTASHCRSGNVPASPLKVPDNASSNKSQGCRWKNQICAVPVSYLVEESLGSSCRQQAEPRCGSEQQRRPLPLQTGDNILGHLQHHPHRLCSL